MKTTKYKAIPTVIDGIRFDSKKEADFYNELKLLKKAENLSEKVHTIIVKPKFSIDVNGKHICNYIADFKVIYWDCSSKVFDVKGFDKKNHKFISTPVYKLKKKLVSAIYGIEIIER